jgi:hypothetical protein
MGRKQTAAFGFTRSASSLAVSVSGARTDGAYGARPTCVGSIPRKMWCMHVLPTITIL